MAVKRERTIVEVDDPGDPEPSETLAVEASAVKAIELSPGSHAYHVLSNRVLDAGERCAIKFSLQRPGTLRRVVLRWRSADGKVSRESSLNGSRQLDAHELVELETESLEPTRSVIVNVWAHVDTQ